MPEDRAARPIAGAPRGVSRAWWLRPLSGLLLAIGAFFLLAGGVRWAGMHLNTWLLAQDRFLAIRDARELPAAHFVPTALPASASQAKPLSPSAQPPAQSPFVALRSATPGEPGSTAGPPTGAGAASTAFQAADAVLTTTAQPTAAAPPVATPLPPAAVRIRIPAIGVDRSIIELPLTYDERTRTWTRDIKKLLRTPGKDLVGHWGGSAHPGQAGNTILVGHNYGYGYSAVFVKLGLVKVGAQVQLVDSAGQILTYEVSQVARVPWRRKDAQELAHHQVYLAMGGPERLTLVSCGGATWEPFPLRVYVVAEPIR